MDVARHPDRRPRVVFDMSFADKSVTGTRVYAHQLQTAVEASGRFDVLTLPLMPPPVRRSWRGRAQNLIWSQVQLPLKLASLEADVLHAAAYVGPWRAPCPVVVNVFDTLYLTYPDDYDYKWRLYARLLIPRTIRRAAAIITLSEYSKAQIVQSYGIARERVHVIYPGVAEGFTLIDDAEAISAIRGKYALGEAYCLYVGGLERRKNVVELIRAVTRLRAGEFPRLTLVIAGPRNENSAEVTRAIEQGQHDGTVKHLGYIPDADLPRLYAGARCFVFPSRLEGFGIPLIEAMACGTPVVATPCPPMPEVVGDAAWLASAPDANALSAAIARVWGDVELQRQLKLKGLERARRFSWERAARQTIELYEQVMGERQAACPA